MPTYNKNFAIQIRKSQHQGPEEHCEGLRGVEATVPLPRHKTSAQARAIGDHHHGLCGTEQFRTADVRHFPAGCTHVHSSKALSPEACVSSASATPRHWHECEEPAHRKALHPIMEMSLWSCGIHCCYALFLLSCDQMLHIFLFFPRVFKLVFQTLCVTKYV